MNSLVTTTRHIDVSRTTWRLVPLLTVLLLVIVSAFSEAHAQRTVIIEPGFGTINDAIMGDTTATGARVDSNTVYVLRGGLTFEDRYYLNGRIRSGNYHLQVVAEEGATHPPVLQVLTDETGSSTSRFFDADGDLTIRGLYILGMNDLDAPRNHVAIMNGDNKTLVVDDCIVEYYRFIVFRVNGENGSVRLTNSFLRNVLTTNNPGNGKVVDPRGNNLESLYVENTTFSGISGELIRLSGAIMNSLFFNHNTVYTMHGFVRDDVQEHSNKLVEGSITNNLFVNMGWVGDTTNTADAPSHWERAIFTFDSLAVVPDLEETDRDVLISRNNFFWEQELVDYFNSGFQATCDLCTGGTVKQYSIFNSRAQRFVDAGLVRYELAMEENPEFGHTPGLTGFIDWSKGYWTDPASVSEEMLIYDPDGTQEVTTWPLLEDYSYPTTKASYTAAGGDFPLGDLNWFPERKAAWMAAGGGTGILVDREDAVELPGALVLKGNYPNPFNPSTTVRFDLPSAAKVHVEVFDVLGRSMLSTPAQPLASGADRSITVQAGALPSGLYLYRIVAQTGVDVQTQTGTMVLLK